MSTHGSTMLPRRSRLTWMVIASVLWIGLGGSSISASRDLPTLPSAEDGAKTESLAHDDGEMDLGLTYRDDVSADGTFLSLFRPGSTPTTVTSIRSCWTRDADFRGSSSLDYQAVLYEYDPAADAPGALLARVPARASSVPLSSDGGREGANCRFYGVPLEAHVDGPKAPAYGKTIGA